MLAAAQYGSNGCLAVFDIDNFKHINDRLRHHVGDLVLRDFAYRIHQNVRRNDCFGRVSGEEFLLVMPATGPEDAIAIIERMLTVIRFSRPLPDSSDFSYTCSGGIAACDPSDSASELYRRRSGALCRQAERPGQGACRVGPDDGFAAVQAGRSEVAATWQSAPGGMRSLAPIASGKGASAFLRRLEFGSKTRCRAGATV